MRPHRNSYVKKDPSESFQIINGGSKTLLYNHELYKFKRTVSIQYEFSEQ